MRLVVDKTHFRAQLSGDFGPVKVSVLEGVAAFSVLDL